MINRYMKQGFLTISLTLIMNIEATFASNIAVNGIYYDFDSSTETATVTYRGSNHTSYSGEYKGSINIPATVTYNSVNYRVTAIGEHTFQGCQALASVSMGNNITTIEPCAFYVCKGLTSVTFSNSITSIGLQAFYGCAGLSSVSIPNSVIIIGEGAFEGCSNLSSISIGNNVANIGAFAFYDCVNLTSCVLPNSVQKIGEAAFLGCSSLKTLTIPNASVVCTGSNVSPISAVEECDDLQTIYLGTGMKFIDENDDDILYPGIFLYTSNLQNIHVDENNQYYSSVDGIMFNKSKTEILRYPAGRETEYVIPSGIQCIRDDAFSYCRDLISVTIPSSVTTISSEAFFDCTNLKTIYNYASTPQSINEDVFSWVNKSACTLYVPASSFTAYQMANVWKDFNIQPMISNCAITWKQDDGTTIDQTVVEYGQIPTHADPTKPATAEYTYTFAGWTPMIVAATENTTYTATYILVVNDATISQDCSQNGIIASLKTQNSRGGHSYVDLGLPSGLLWATCNIGAEQPEHAGGYYSWGEISTKNSYLQNNYLYKSNQISLNDISGTEYDAARANWGGKWRMPTRTEMSELASNCTRKDTTINSVNGMTLRSKFNNNAIFIPKAGLKEDASGVAKGTDEIWPRGVGMWTSTAYGSTTAYRALEWSYISYSWRWQALPIRPVCSRSDVPTLTHTITLFSEGCTTPNIYTCVNGQEVKIIAAPIDCYRFKRWSDGNIDNPRTIIATEDKTYTAEFEKIKYTITTESDDDNQGSATVSK